MMSQISQAPPPIRHNDLNHLSHVTCISLITQSTQHYKGTQTTPALCLISIIWSGLSTATRYDLLDTYLFRNLPPVPPPHGFLCLPRLSPLVCQRAAIDLGCVLLLVIHEFLARQVPSVYPLLSRQTTKSHAHHFRITSASTITTSSPSMIASPMAKPTPFSGFLLQCSLYIEMQPHLYSTERSKVLFIISLLSGKALQWAETIWAQSSNIIQSFDNFVAHFREVFGHPYGDPSTSDQLYHLRQGSLPIKEYALRFRTLAAASGWN